MGKGAYGYSRRDELNSHSSHGARREPISESCALTFMSVLVCVFPAPQQINKYSIKIWRVKWKILIETELKAITTQVSNLKCQQSLINKCDLKFYYIIHILCVMCVGHVCVCARMDNVWNWFFSSAMWVWVLNQGHTAWWYMPLLAGPSWGP